MAGSPILVIDNIVKKYGDKTALRGVSLEIGRGEIYTLLGPNGAGKTTLMNIVVGVLSPDEGSIAVMGMSPRSPHARATIGYCPQEDGLTGSLTGLENISFYARLKGLPPREALRDLKPVLEELELVEHLGKRVEKYSGGMKKKLSFAISLIGSPELLVLDEPTTGLDPRARRAVWKTIIEQKEKGVGVLIATHNMEEADRISSRVGIIDEGRIIVEGEPGELKKKYGPPSVIVVEPLAEINTEAEKALREHFPKTIVDKQAIRIHVEDPDEALPQVVLLARRAGISIRSIRVEKPSLEDVFLKLTGKRLE